jgi:hypothetical protein
VCKSFSKIEFASQDITAFGGLELIRRYGYLIVVPERNAKTPVQAINGRCLNAVIGLRGCWSEEKRRRS